MMPAMVSYRPEPGWDRVWARTGTPARSCALTCTAISELPLCSRSLGMSPRHVREHAAPTISQELIT